jgi:hypothetical protein
MVRWALYLPVREVIFDEECVAEAGGVAMPGHDVE